MNLSLLLPAALAALAALILPLLIHLARRSEQRPTDFAALRWLRQRPKPRHRIRFDEWPLLLLRLLLLALLALWLARPVLFGAESARPWIVVAPGADAQVARARADATNARLHWLAPGFPRLDAAAPPPPAPLSSLLRELDADLPAATVLSVFVPERMSGADGQRPQLSRPVEWRVLPGTTPAATPIREIVTPSPAIRYAADRATALPYLRAAIEAWRDPAVPDPSRQAPSKQDSVAPSTQALPSQSRELIWLVPGAVPAQVREFARNGGRVLLDAGSGWPSDAASPRAPLWRDASGAVLAEGVAFGRGRLMRLTRAVTPQAMPELLEPGFPRRLRELFAPSLPAPAWVSAKAHAPATGGAAYALPPRDLRLWWALLIALVFVCERWLATRARRGATP
ncbi:BatA domain-containing protein [Lysobacter sp. 1R34A]|uniref:BatA domain-containing protein n=1 Tax=Lysobacter sp. 1R34A TaxID=3445786 RepID=UPI003EED985F